MFPEDGGHMDAARLTRFWKKVDVQGPDECWLWTASVNSRGYGSFGIAPYKTALAHKVAWALAKNDGVLSDPKSHVMHSCDVKRCVNASHLTLGTAGENNRDAVARGLRPNPYRRSLEKYCNNGHLRTPETTSKTYNACIPCVKASNARSYAKRNHEEYSEYNKGYRARKKAEKAELAKEALSVLD